jgi:hypothetical protein
MLLNKLVARVVLNTLGNIYLTINIDTNQQCFQLFTGGIYDDGRPCWAAANYHQIVYSYFQSGEYYVNIIYSAARFKLTTTWSLTVITGTPTYATSVSPLGLCPCLQPRRIHYVKYLFAKDTPSPYDRRVRWGWYR